MIVVWLARGFRKYTTRLTVTRVAIFVGEEMEAGNTANRHTALPRLSLRLPWGHLQPQVRTGLMIQWKSSHPLTEMSKVQATGEFGSYSSSTYVTLPESPPSSTQRCREGSQHLSECLQYTGYCATCHHMHYLIFILTIIQEFYYPDFLMQNNKNLKFGKLLKLLKLENSI